MSQLSLKTLLGIMVMLLFLSNKNGDIYMNKLLSPISVYFTVNTCRDLSKYLKGLIPSIQSSKNLALLMSTIYIFGEDNMPNLLYHGWMFRGISSDHPITLNSLREMEWASWSINQDIAIDFAKKNNGQYKYIICRKNKAINPSGIKDTARLYFEDYHSTGLDTYNPSREKEVIAPMLRSECSIISI